MIKDNGRSEVLQKNRIWVSVYIAIGIFNSFMTNFKAGYFQKVVDGLASKTVLLSGVFFSILSFWRFKKSAVSIIWSIKKWEPACWSKELRTVLTPVKRLCIIFGFA